MKGMEVGSLKSELASVYRACREWGYRLVGCYPHLQVSGGSYPLRRMGTEYGGWTFVDSPDLYQSTVLSCGLGEDASFDVEFARRYGARVILMDPTPRAVAHYQSISGRFGKPRSKGYSGAGRESADSYDLEGVSRDKLLMVEKALWNAGGRLKFFAPQDPTHVSHSLVNFQNGYRDSGASIEVAATTIDEVIREFDVPAFSLVKLDIEGAEIEVLEDMMKKHVRPRQLLIEYDELLAPSKRAKRRVENAHRRLLAHGYVLAYKEATNFSYVLE